MSTTRSRPPRRTARGSPSSAAASEGGIFLIDADGGNLRRVTRGGTDPAWSPDGSQLASRASTPATRPARTSTSAASAGAPSAACRPRRAHRLRAAGRQMLRRTRWLHEPSSLVAGRARDRLRGHGLRHDGRLRRPPGRHGAASRHAARRVAGPLLAGVVVGRAARLRHRRLHGHPELWVQFGARTWQDVTPSFATRPAWSPDGALLVLGGVGPQRLAVVVGPDGRQTEIPGLTGVVDADWAPAQ